MQTYSITLTRSFTVEIDAESLETASKCAEFFVGYFDISSEEERAAFHFQIRSIDMVANDVLNIQITSVI